MPWVPPDPPDAPVGAWTPPDPPDAPGQSTAAGLFREQLQAPIQQAEQRRQEFIPNVARDVTEIVTQDVPRMARDVGQYGLDTSEAQYRSLLAPLGLMEPNTPEQSKLHRQAAIDMLLTALGGKLAGSAARKGGDVVKYLARGGRTIPGAERFIASQAPLAGSAARAASWKDLIGPSLSGAAAGAAVDWLDPTPYELTDKPVAGATGVATTMAVARNTINDLLVSNPRWQAWAMSPSKGQKAMLAGAIVGLLLSRGIAATEDQARKAIDEWRQGETP